MKDVTQESWKGHQINIRAVPVRHIQTPASVPDGYLAIVQICDAITARPVPIKATPRVPT